MGQGRGIVAGGVLLVVAALSAGEATAEIYKWVDEQGNVHFGDKPLDEETAEQAEKVDIVESYQPTERTAEEQSDFEREQEALRRRHELYKEEDRKARQKEEEQRRAQLASFCSEVKKEIAKFSEVHMVGGVPTYYYLKDENGESFSSERQRQYVAELREKYAEAGCK